MMYWLSIKIVYIVIYNFHDQYAINKDEISNYTFIAMNDCKVIIDDKENKYSQVSCSVDYYSVFREYLIDSYFRNIEFVGNSTLVVNGKLFVLMVSIML